jgi:hypothetical protein
VTHCWARAPPLEARRAQVSVPVAGQATDKALFRLALVTALQLTPHAQRHRIGRMTTTSASFGQVLAALAQARPT